MRMNRPGLPGIICLQRSRLFLPQMYQRMIWQTTELPIRMCRLYGNMRRRKDCEVFVVCAEIEAEISQLDDDEKKMFLDDLGLEESGLEKLIKASYHLLGLISYLTAGEPESPRLDHQEGNKSASGSRQDPFRF